MSEIKNNFLMEVKHIPTWIGVETVNTDQACVA